MSMTKEEAFKKYEEWRNLGFGHSTMPSSEVLVMAMNSLRPVSREQVERVRGYWIEDEYSFSHCSLCGYEQEEPELITPFCPNCGAPLTDEAVEMVMKKLEALYDTSN